MKSEQPKTDNTSTGIVKVIGGVALFILISPAVCVSELVAEGGPLAIITIAILLCLTWNKYG